jgi:hypothetical protein
MVYDDNLGKVLFFGGRGLGNAFSGETVAFDGATWEVVATTGPQPRAGAVAVFDPSIRKVVLFGGVRVLPAGQTDCGGGLTAGAGGVCSYRDTWLWDGAAWTRACDSTTADCGTEPQARDSAKLAYDPVRSRAVLFGGTGAACGVDTMCADFYEWNGAAWTRPTPGDAAGDGSAHGRVNHVLGWDPLGRRLVLAGGEDEFDNCLTTALCRETWQWTGSDWRLVTDPARTAPTLVQGGGVLAFDQARGELVLSNPVNDHSGTTWGYNGGVWTAYTTGNPPVVGNSSGTGSPNGIFRFGGTVDFSSIPTGELYRRTGTTWAALPWTSRPLARTQAGLAAVLAPAGYVLMYGGTYQTYPTQPTCSDGSTGTCYLDDTWGYGVWGTPTCSLSAATCWRFFGAGPPRRADMALVGTTGSEAILFGGRGGSGFPVGDTWRWNGTTWTQVAGAGPTGRWGATAAYDARRAKTVIASGTASDPTFCGATSTGQSCRDVWEFDGAAWKQRRVADPEGDGGLQTAFGVGAYSTDGGVYAPGDGGNGRLFRWDGGFGLRPALVAEFDLSAAGAPVGTVVERVELAATVKASSSAAGAATTGVELLAGEPLGWRAVASGDGGAGFANLAWCASRTAAPGCEVVREGKLLLGRAGTILVGAAPAGTNGTGIATVTLDYVEAKVRYRMPDPAEE